MSGNFYRISQSLKYRGVLRTIQSGLSILEDLCFDLRYRTDTQRRVDLADLTIVGDSKGEGNQYHPMRGHAFRKVMSRVPFPQGSVFVDFGSGKGKTLLLASRLGFKRAVGVEFSTELCVIAENNAKVWCRSRECGEIQVLCIDAGDYAFKDDENVFFMFNPFGAGVMKRVIANISASLGRHPRKAWIIYGDPRKRELIEALLEASEILSYSYGGIDIIVWTIGEASVNRKY